MRGLDAQAAGIAETARAYSGELRRFALAIDADPGAAVTLLDSAAIREMLRLGDGLSPIRVLDTVAATVELATGDAGTLLAAPGASLAGVVVRLMGDTAQQEHFADRIADGRTWTFCAITEPHAGSDAAAMTATLTPGPDGKLRVNGVKRYIGGGARASIGVVFARTGPSPLAIQAALVETGHPGFTAEPLDMIGLRGLQISQLQLSGVPVADGMLLGAHLPPVRRGMWGAVRAFNAVRVQIAGLATGTATAVHDYVRDELGSSCDALRQAAADIAAIRALTYRAAEAVDADPGNSHLPALAKAEAVRLVRAVTAGLPSLLGPAARLEHPLLGKWWRDASGFEFMEGTTAIQRLAVAQGYLTGRFGAGPAAF